MVPIAYSRLRHLCDQCLRVPQQQTHHRAETRELVFQQLGLQSHAIAGALHDGVAWGRLAAHEQGYAEHALVAYDGDFRRRAICHHVQQRNDGSRGEIDMPQPSTGFVEDLTQFHPYQFQVRLEARVVASPARRRADDSDGECGSPMQPHALSWSKARPRRRHGSVSWLPWGYSRPSASPLCGIAPKHIRRVRQRTDQRRHGRYISP